MGLNAKQKKTISLSRVPFCPSEKNLTETRDTAGNCFRNQILYFHSFNSQMTHNFKGKLPSIAAVKLWFGITKGFIPKDQSYFSKWQSLHIFEADYFRNTRVTLEPFKLSQLSCWSGEASLLLFLPLADRCQCRRKIVVITVTMEVRDSSWYHPEQVFT